MLQDPIQALNPPVAKNGTFRIQNTKIHLTYPTQIDAPAYLEWLSPKLRAIHVKEYSFTNDSINDCHVYLKFNRNFQTTSPKFFDYNGVHPIIKKITSKAQRTEVLAYHNTQNNQFTNITNSKPQDQIIPTVEWREWQQELFDELATKPDPRKIIWYWDPNGNTGKTFFIKHMGMYYNATVLNSCKIEYLETESQVVNDPIILFNANHSNNIYRTIESLKDGVSTSKDKTVYSPTPHLVIFANYLPDFSECSLDKWDIRAISPDGQSVLTKFDGQDVTDTFDYYVEKHQGIDRKTASNILKVFIHLLVDESYQEANSCFPALDKESEDILCKYL